jgi:hypothetical protein
MGQAITVTPVGGRDFRKGVAAIKGLNGRFNPATKTWIIPAQFAPYFLDCPARYYARLVGDAATSSPVASGARCDECGIRGEHDCQGAPGAH